MNTTEESASGTVPPPAEISWTREENRLRVTFRGAWRMDGPRPPLEALLRATAREAGVRAVVLDGSGIHGWDSSLLAFVVKLREGLLERGVEADPSALPGGVRRLLALAAAVPKHAPSRAGEKEPFLARLGGSALAAAEAVTGALDFMGRVTCAFLRLLGGRARLRGSDLLYQVQECGARALPITALISFLVGLILAFVGAVQLADFGAQIYVASLVGISMVRVMGAVMTGVIMAGRNGAAFAAELGTMQVNEETDALRTLGIPPVEFLVLPRMIAMTLMMPLLCLFSDLVGTAGGFLVGVGLFDLNPVEYLNQTREAVPIRFLWIGLFHSLVFGVLVSAAGCYKGLHCGRSAADVGRAATSAVVTGIVLIIVATAVITVCCNVLDI